jgi:hypothetical protein
VPLKAAIGIEMRVDRQRAVRQGARVFDAIVFTGLLCLANP